MARNKKSRQARKERRKNRKARHQSTSKLNVESLDPRILMDASGAISEAFEAVQSADLNAQQNQTVQADAAFSDSQSVTSSSLRHEIVFIDAGVEGQDELLDDLQTSRPGVLREVVHVNADSDGLQQIADALDGRTGIDAVHIVSHGESAQLNLGNAEITGDELNIDYASQLATIGQSLDADADVLIYGCDFAQGQDGADAVTTLSKLTGADVAASDDDTGAADKGGDWDLELQVGAVEAESLAALSYTGLLASQNEVLINVLYDGTSYDTDPLDDGSGDGVHTPGLDGGPNNNVVKTYDTFAVRIDWNVNEDDATGVTLTAELPPFASWAPDPTGMFSGCDVATSSFPDAQTLECSLLDQPEGSNGTIRALATLDQPLDGTEFNVTSTLTTDDDPAGVVDELDDPLVVTEAPIANWLKGAPEVSGPVTSGGSDGYVMLYPVSLIDYSQGATPTLGAGPINSALPIDFFDHAYQLVASATVASAAQMTDAGFAGRDSCGAYDGAGAFPTTVGTWTCGAETSPNGYPVVPINIVGHDASVAPAVNADGSPNSAFGGVNVLTGQIAFWLPAAEVDAEIADPANDSATSALFENAIAQEDASVNITSQDDVAPIQVPGTAGYFDEISTASPEGDDPADNAVRSTIGLAPSGGSPGSTIGHDIKFHPGPLQVLETNRYADGARHNIDLRPLTQGGLWYLPGANVHVANTNSGDFIGETPRGATLTIQSQVLTASTAETSLFDAAIHGCTAFDTTHYSLVEFGDIPVSITDATGAAATANTPVIVGGYTDTSNTGPLAHVYTGSAQTMYNAHRGQINAVGGEKAGLGYVVEFTDASLVTVGGSFGVDEDQLTCAGSDAGPSGWVDATGDLSVFDTVDAGDGVYEGITRARVRITENFPWAPGDADNTNFTGFQAFFQVEVKADLAVQTVNQELFAVQSHSYGDLGPDDVPDLVPYDGQAPADCQPYVVSQWEANGNIDDTNTGWCNNNFVDDGANSFDTTDSIDWDNSSWTRSTTSAAGNTSYLNSSGAVVSIVEANLGMSKSNNAGLGDIKNNGDLVEFTLSPRVVGSTAEALTNVTLSDNLPANYHFVQFLQMPSTPGSSCADPATPDGTIVCRFSEADPAVDTGALPAGLAGGWSDEIVIQVMVVGAIADPDAPTVITNTASVSSTGLGPWDPNTDSFIGEVQAAPKSKTGRANSFLPLPADEGVIQKAVDTLSGPCELHPGVDPPPADWADQCSMIETGDNMSFVLSITNEGNTAFTDMEFVDVFPHNLDETEPASGTNVQGGSPSTLGDGRAPESDFAGGLAFVSMVPISGVPTGATVTTWVTGDDPTAGTGVSRDPDVTVGQGVNTWCDAPGGNVMSGTGACPATAEDVTATYTLIDVPDGDVGLAPAETLELRLTLDPSDEVCDDIWTNTFGFRTPEILLPIRSNDVSIMVDCKFDLALDKTIDPAFTPGADWITEGTTTIDFLMEVTNQGDQIEDFDITDYVDTAVFSFAIADNPDGVTTGDQVLPFTWDPTDPAKPVVTVDGVLGNGESVFVPVTLVIENASGPLENWAEISRFDWDGDPSNGDSDPTNPNNPSTGPLTDEDSVPDAHQAGDNQPTGPGAPGDSVINGVGDGDSDPTNGNPIKGDEDDHDVAGIPVYDLELVKVARDPGLDTSASPWHATFDVTVTNQGNADVFLVDVTEYPPAGLAFDAAATTALWGTEGLTGVSETGGVFTIASIPASGSVTFPMVFDITDLTLSPYVNAAEISAFDDNSDPDDTLSPFAVDVDSTPDGTNDDDTIDHTDPDYDPDGDGDVNESTPGDEDDHDIAEFTIPLIGVAKSVAGTPTALANGNFEVTYQLVIENTGSEVLTDIQLTEDLDTQFGPAFIGVTTAASITSGPSQPGSTAPIMEASWDGGVGASGNTTLFNGTSGTLVPGDVIVVQFTVEVDPDASGTSTPLNNQAEVSASDPDGGTVMDDSDSGTDANDDNTGADGDMGTSDDPTPLALPDISLAKQVNGPYVDNGDGTWTIPYQLVLENTGTVDLTSPSIVDDIQAQLGATVYNGVSNVALDATGVTGGTAPGLSGTWTGAGTADILDGTGTLAPGDTVIVTFDLSVNGSELAANSPLTNQAEGTGDAPTGPVNDLSDDGSDPNTDNPDAPGDEGTTDDPTPIQIPQVGLAKDVVGTPAQLANGNWSVVYQMVMQNTGTVDLNNLQITEDLEIEFGSGVYLGVLTAPSISGPSLPGSVPPILDGSWDAGLAASGNTGVFNGSSGTLVPNDTIVVTFTVEVNPDASGASDGLTNQADASGDAPNGVTVSDPSDDGSDPTNGEDDPTPLVIPEIGVAKQVNDVTEVSTGVYDVQYVVVLENTGTVDLFNLQITEDMAAEFGAGFDSVQVPLGITSSTATTDPTLAATAWDGSANTTFFDGASGQLQPGENVTLNFTVRVDTNAGDTTTPTDWTNQVDAYGESSSGTPTTDVSDDGTNPNTDNGDGTTDDPTPFYVPAIRAAKTYGTIVPNADGTYTVPITITVDNTGTADLTVLSLTEDIAAEFGNAFMSVSNAAITANGSYGGVLPTVNPLWTGDTSVEVIDPSQSNESLLVGESYNFTFDVVVDPDAMDDQSQPLDNQAMVSGEGENFDGSTVTVMDESGHPDATDPDGNDNDNPAVLLIPEVRTTKEYTGAVPNATDPDNWDVTFDLVVENTGSADLTGIDLYDDFVTQWGPVFQSVVSVTIDDTTGVGSGNPPTLNYGGTAGATPFDGGVAEANLLNNDGLLEPGEYVTITVTVTIDPDATGESMALENQTQAAGDGPGGEVTDMSDDGTNPNSDNPDGDGDMGTSDDPTPLALPDLSVTKEVFGTPTEMANGNYEVTYRLILENTGLVDLDNLQISEDLETHLGAGIFVSVTSAPAINSGPTDAGSTAPTLATWDGGLSGSPDINIFNGTSGTLVPGDAVEILFSVEIDATLASQAGLLTNQVTATANDPDGNGVMDESDDGNDPNGDNPDAPGDMGTTDDPTPLQIPRIGLAKEVAGPYVDNMDGTYTIPFQLTLTNTGTVDLTNPSIIDNLQSELGATVFDSINTVAIDTTGVVGGTAPGLNAAWIGDTNDNVLDGAGTLAPQDTVVVTFNVVVDGLELAANSPMENQATAAGDDENGITVMDESDDGTDPDGDNPGEPGDDGMGGTDDPTPIQIPQIGLAKDIVGSPTQLANGNYSVTYQMVLQNTGTVDLVNVQIAEDLEMEFGAGVYVGMITAPSITVGASDPGSTDPGLDASWDGGLAASGNTDLLNGTSGTLVPGDTITIQFVVEVDPDATGESTPLENTAVATGEDENGITVMDDSDDGAEADNGEDDPTPLDIPEISLAKQVDGPYVDNGDGTWTIPYQLVLENTGTVDLANPSIVDDISTQLGGAFNSVANLAIDATGVVGGTAPGVDATWDGASTSNILDGTGNLVPGDVVVVTFDLVVNGTELAANSPLTNQAEGTGDGPGGAVMDLSDDGDDPNTDNPGTPGDEGTTDDPTPIQIPQIGLAKQVVGAPTRMANGNYEVTYQMVVQNTGTVDLTNLQLTEDLEMEFGVGVYVSMLTPPAITAGPSDPGSSAPVLDAAWDGGLAASGNTGIFNGTTGTLVPNDTITVQFVVEVNPDASTMSTALENTAEVSGEDPSGTPVTDESDDGADANNGEDDATPLVLAEVSLVKQVNGPYVDNGDGTWTIPYQLILENTGSVDLTNPSITDDIQTQLGAAVYNSVANVAMDSTGVVNGTAPGLDATWDGTTTDNALDGTGTLAPGDFVTVTFDLVVNGDALAAASPLNNQATGTGDGGGGTVMDQSDDGDDPNGDNPGTPGDEGTTDDPTPIQIPQIGLAKNVVGSPIELANGNFEVHYQLVLQNTGTVDLTNVQITEDLEAEFGAGVFVGITNAPTISSGPSLAGSIAPTLDSGWTAGLGGTTATGIFDGTSGVLVPNDTITILFCVEVDPDANGPATALENTAVASGDDANGVTVMDDSDDGTDANNGEDDPTPLDIPDINAAKETVGPAIQTATNPEHFDVTYQVVVENTGNVTLDGLDLYDDIATEFGGAYVAISGSPTITANTLADPTTLPTINGGWDANTALSIFNDDGSLLPGETITIQFVVTVDAVVADGATLLNQVNVVADDPATGAEDGPSDLSDDGSDTTANNDGSPGDQGTSDDPTPVLLPNATIGLAKAVTEVVGTTVTMDFVIENVGNVDALSVSLVDSFDATYGAGNYTMDAIAVSVAPQDATSSITANTAFDGSGDTDMLTATGNTLAVGDTATITATVTITTLTDPDGAGPLGFGQYENTATTTSEDVDGNEYTDVSQDGTDPDGDGDGDVKDDNVPTPVDVAPNVPVEIVKDATVNGDSITYHLEIENTGNSIALNVAIQDNLDNVFGAGNYVVNGVTMTMAPTAATSSLTLNPNYTGSNGTTAGVANAEILDTSASNTLEKDDTAAFDVSVTVTKVTDPDVAGPLLFGEYDNTSTVSNEDVAGGTYSDEDPAITAPIDPTANIDIEKTATAIGDDSVSFELQITNNGNSLADQVSVVDNLDSVFGAGNYVINGITMSVPPQDADSSLSVNLNYNGGAGVTGGVLNNEVLNTLNNNLLDVGDSATFTINLTASTFIDQDGTGGMMLGEFLNSATVTNEDPTDDTYTDTSEGNVSFTPDATVGVAKDSNWNDDSDTGTYTFYLEHFGNTQAVNLSMIENLDAIYGAGNYSVTGPVKLSGPSSIIPNAGYNGSSNNDLLDGSSTLQPGDTATLEIGLTVHTIVDAAGDGLGTYINQVTLTGEDVDGNTYADESVDGTDPDPSGDGDPSEAGPSNGFLTPQAWVGGAKTATVSEDSESVTFDFYLEHLGNSPAFNVTLIEDLDAVLGAGNYTVTNITKVAGPAGVLANGAFTGSGSNQGLIIPSSVMNPGETAQIQITVGLDGAFGNYENQATVTTENGEGGTYEDLTHNGTDPDPDGDGDPRNNEDPTPFQLASGELAGNVYVDSDNDGVFDDGEVPIPGVIVTLTGTDINGNPVTLTTTTAADGSYFFDDLLPGDYTVRQSQPAGFIDGMDTLGNFGGAVSNDGFEVSLGNNGDPFSATEYNYGEVGIDPLSVGKDPFLASAANGVAAPQPAKVVHQPFAAGDGIDEDGSTLRVEGTNGDDDIHIAAGLSQHVVTVNDVSFQYDAATFDKIVVKGYDGADKITIVGTSLDDQADMLATLGKFVSQNYHISYDGMEEASVYGGDGGLDKAVMADSAGNDVFLGSATFASMREINNAYRNESRGFDIITGNSVLGGYDRAVVFGTSGDDHLKVVPEFARLTRGAGNTEFRANRFERFEARGEGGNDFAEFTDSVGNDHMTLEDDKAVLVGAGFHNTATDFKTVHARATRGGTDSATFFDSAGDDTYSVRPAKSIYMTGINYENRIWGFDSSVAFANKGGFDSSFLYDTAGNDVFIARPTTSSMRGTLNGATYEHVTNNFEVMTGHAMYAGFDAAFLYDGAGDDSLTIRPDFVEVRGANDSFKHRLLDFQTVVADGNAGGDDTATFLDSPVFSSNPTNDVFTSFGTETVFAQEGTDFRKTARGYETTMAFSTVGVDTAVFDNVQVFEQLNGAAANANIAARGTTVNGFDRVRATNKPNHNPTADIDAVSYVFEQVGEWFNI